ncbi:MAG TPA: methyltransferase domain-containing protein [Gemmatimonadetes bacterium]|nr:methyltransferase domain-containing protein [Gemmatimonadota bacterium]
MSSDAPVSKQERIWRGEFGDAYVDRNAGPSPHLAALTENWARILRATRGAPPTSILEVGANVGLNLRALRRLTDAKLFALEPNAKALAALLAEGLVPPENALDGLCSSIELPDRSVDLVFTSGVLIHIHPDDLPASCDSIHRVSRRYVVCIEYFSDKPEEVPYRKQTEALFKRDFGGYYLDRFPDLRVLDYGFAWKRLTGLDNLTWWLFEKQP